MHQLEPSEKPDLSKTAISGKHFWIILSRVVQNFVPESNQGWAPEREKEREGEREVGEGQRAREGERREEGGEERADTGRGHCTTVQQEAASAENRLSKEHASNHLHAHKSQSNIIYNTCCSLGGRLLQK